MGARVEAARNFPSPYVDGGHGALRTKMVFLLIWLEWPSGDLTRFRFPLLLIKWQVLAKIDLLAAFLKSGFIQRDVWLVLPEQAAVVTSRLRTHRRSVSGLAEPSAEFYQTLTGFLRNG